MKKRFLSTALILFLLLSLLPQAVLAKNFNEFTDIEETDWYYSYAAFCAEREYFLGTDETTFSPESTMTRAMFVTVLARVDEAETDSTVSTFDDVETGVWYTGAIAWAAENGIINGYGDGTFGPEDPVTREQMCVIMLRYIAYYETASDVICEETEDAVDFPDLSDSSSEEMCTAIRACQQYGLVSGFDDGCFYPMQTSTRAQVAAVICRLVNLIEAAVDVESEDDSADVQDEEPSDTESDSAEQSESTDEVDVGSDADSDSSGDSTEQAGTSGAEDEDSSEQSESIDEEDAGNGSDSDSSDSESDSTEQAETPDSEDEDSSEQSESTDEEDTGNGSDSDSSDSGSSSGSGSNSSGGSFGGSSTVTQGTTANEITEDGTYTGLTYTSTGSDENALRITGATVTLDGITVNKASGSTSNTENGDFYGVNAALLSTDGAQVTITNATITSSAQNGNGVFSYGSGTVVTISDSTITTTADNSGGIQTTGGGTTYAYNLTVVTSGSSSAAIRSDRGGGTVVVDGGTYTSNGYNSPAIYSTADITVSNATLTANNSEALVIEGKNSITLTGCDVSGNMSDTNGTSSDINVHSVMIYQSMSGDADVGTSSFSMTGGSLTSNNGDVIFVTNTSCTIYLSDVEIISYETNGNLLTISGNNASHGWGSAGSNGANVVMTADAQVLEGSIEVDTISTLDLTLTNGSTLTGTINIVDNAEGGKAVNNNAVITIGEGCTWTLTGDCTITSLTNGGTINYNGYTITLADGTILSE